MASMQVGHGMPHQSGVGHPDGSVGNTRQLHNYGHTGMGQQTSGQQGPMGGGPPQGQPPQQQQQAPPPKELNAAMLCRFGKETVQEIVARSLELFQLLKQTQPPDGKINIGMDRKTKFHEALKNIKGNFKRLRVIYEKIEENFPSNKDIQFEEDILNKSDEMAADDKRITDIYKHSVEEYKEVMEHVMVKNRHLKESIDHLQTMIWDVNTMLAMRKE